MDTNAKCGATVGLRRPIEKIATLVADYEKATAMRAIGMTRRPAIGTVPETIEMLAVPVARPAANEVAIRLCASAMHVDEIFAAQGTVLGRFGRPKGVADDRPHVLGSSAVGVVVGIGSGPSPWSLGDEVIVVPNELGDTGSWAAYRCVKKQWIIAKPAEMSPVQAAAISMAACVAWGAVRTAQAKSGDRCLVVGASGAVGIMSVQYLKALGCHVVAVCSGDNSAMVRQYGADSVVDYTKQNFARHAQGAGISYDCIIDCVGGLEIERDAFISLKKSGVFATVVGPRKYIGERKLSWREVVGAVSHVVCRQVTTVWRGPHYRFCATMPRNVIRSALADVQQNSLSMPIERVIPLHVDAIRESMRLLTGHRSRGRIVIDFDSKSSSHEDRLVASPDSYGFKTPRSDLVLSL